MARRSVSLPPNLERTVRRLQATLLTTMDRDISFTETLNLALAASFAVPDLARRVTTDEWQNLLEGSDWDAEGVLVDTASMTNRYELLVHQTCYTLRVNGTVRLEGRLRDYSAFVGPIDPYETANMIFLGDDTGSASANSPGVAPQVEDQFTGGDRLDIDLHYIGRAENASPAVASAKMHKQEQDKILIEAIGLAKPADAVA